MSLSTVSRPFFSPQGKPPTKKAKVLHKAAWSAKIGAFLHSQGTGQLADGTPTGQDGKQQGPAGLSLGQALRTGPLIAPDPCLPPPAQPPLSHSGKAQN